MVERMPTFHKMVEGSIKGFLTHFLFIKEAKGSNILWGTIFRGSAWLAYPQEVSFWAREPLDTGKSQGSRERP